MNPAKKSRFIKLKPDKVCELREKGIEIKGISGMFK